jgi:hypothetical protein
MKLTIPANKFFLDGSSGRESAPTFPNEKMSRLTPAATKKNCAAFTLAEVLAALLFLAIVIPTAVEALHIASLAGEVAVRKSAAARVADRILNESVVTTNWNNGLQSGTVTEGTLDLQWKLTSQNWAADPVHSAQGMQLLTAEVTFSAQGKDYSVKLSTLANSQTQPPVNMNPQF